MFLRLSVFEGKSTVGDQLNAIRYSFLVGGNIEAVAENEISIVTEFVACIEAEVGRRRRRVHRR